jgi:hypothetical protein
MSLTSMRVVRCDARAKETTHSRRHALAGVAAVIALAPRRARAEESASSSSTTSIVDAFEAQLSAFDPWADARRERAQARAMARKSIDSRIVQERIAKEKEDERARAVYAEQAARRKTRARLEREDELTPEEIDREVIRAGEDARIAVERGLQAEEIELAAYERRQAELRATAEARNAEFLLSSSAAPVALAEAEE